MITRIREKGIKHGFEELYYSHFRKTVKIEETKTVEFDSTVRSAYRIRYNGDFFSVARELEDKLLLDSSRGEILVKYNFKMVYPDGPEPIMVDKKDTTLITELNNNKYALYRGEVVKIITRKDEKVLIALDMNRLSLIIGQRWGLEAGWKRAGNTVQKWIPRINLYIYGEEECPLRV